MDICLSCFNGACGEHSVIHYRKTGHCLVLNVKRTAVDDEKQHPSKLSRVEIQEMAEDRKEYNFFYLVKCLACTMSWGLESSETKALVPCAQAVIASVAASKKIAAQAWHEEIIVCEHSQHLEQSIDPLAAKLRAKSKCNQCDLEENLWMCLTCGNIGCGRQQFDGSGGNGHGSKHFETHQHPLAIKLGTITADGSGDVHCYVCDEMRLDPELEKHLVTFGIDITTVEKTEQTMAELQLEQNLKYDFSMVTDDGRQLEPIHGPGLVGLKNLGNSCYLSSVIQSLSGALSCYYGNDKRLSDHIKTCHKDPPSCFVCQAGKLFNAMLKGSPEKLSPWMFKSVSTNGHPDFSTARQQDASEFISYLLKVIQRSDPAGSRNVLDQFTFTQQQRIVCNNCGDQRYQKTVTNQLSLQLSDILASNDVTLQDKLHLDQFLKRCFANEQLDGAKCEKCHGNDGKTRSMTLLSFPKFLIISLSRYVIRDWVPRKLDMTVQVPFAELDLGEFKGDPCPAGDFGNPMMPQIDEVVLAELTSMGFPMAKCKKAIVETGNKGTDAAMNWIFEHEDLQVSDKDIDNHMENDKQRLTHISEEFVQTLVDAGFTKQQATKALNETENNLERAFDWILSHSDTTEKDLVTSFPVSKDDKASASTQYRLASFISHKGPSIHCGHYVAHVLYKPSGLWIMFNDEQVVVADPQPPALAAEKAYVFIYERID